MSSIAAAASGYMVLIVAAHSLAQAENADFLAFWGVLLGLFGVLTGLMTEATRAVKTRSMSHPVHNDTGAPVILVSVLIGAAAAILVTATSPWWLPVLIPNASPLLWLGIALSILLYAGHVGLAGVTSGLERWGIYSVLSATEALVRLAAIAGAALLAGGLAGIEFGALAGTVVWLFFAAFSGGGRAALRARADVGTWAYLVRCGFAMATAAASAVLITGFPAVIKIIANPVDFALAAPLLLAVSLTRAPIMIPLQAFQGVAMTALIHSPKPAHRVLAKPFLAIAGLGIIGGVLAAVIGPYVMLIFGPGYALDGWLLGALTLAAAFLAMLTLTGTAAMALGRHGLYLSGWLVATGASVLLLLLPMPLAQTVVVSLSVGPILGALVHATGVLAAGAKTIPSPQMTKAADTGE